MRFEIKLSTLWREGVYWFQQLRDQDYEAVICLGISPFAAHCWVISKATILEQWERAGGLTPQHKGKEGVDTRKLTVDPAAPPDWLVPLGGTLSQGLAALRRIVDRPRT